MNIKKNSNMESTDATNETFTIIDFLQVIVDNLRLLVIGPFVAGFVVFTAASLWPKTYESTAILKAEQLTASLIHSAAVLDPVAKSLGYTRAIEIDDARLRLKKEIQTRYSTKDKLFTLTTKAHAPEAAQVLNITVLEQVYAQSKPRGSEKTRLEKLLEQAIVSEKESRQSVELLSEKLENKATSVGSDFVQGYAQIMRIMLESQVSQSTIKQQLNGLDASALMQEPTLPSNHSEPKRVLITALTIQVTLFLLLIWTFTVNAIRKSERNINSTKKMAILKESWRKAIGL